jgi:hypothetical protein
VPEPAQASAAALLTLTMIVLRRQAANIAKVAKLVA